MTRRIVPLLLADVELSLTSTLGGDGAGGTGDGGGMGDGEGNGRLNPTVRRVGIALPEERHQVLFKYRPLR